MSYIHDAIMESHQLEDVELHNKTQAKKKRLPKITKAVAIEECGEQPIQEEKLVEETFVDIEEYLPKESYVESLSTNLKEQIEYPKSYQDRINKRIGTYRKLCNLDESVEITEEHIDNHKWAFNRTCMWEGVSPDKFRAELLNREY